MVDIILKLSKPFFLSFFLLIIFGLSIVGQAQAESNFSWNVKVGNKISYKITKYKMEDPVKILGNTASGVSLTSDWLDISTSNSHIILPNNKDVKLNSIEGLTFTYEITNFTKVNSFHSIPTEKVLVDGYETGSFVGLDLRMVTNSSSFYQTLATNKTAWSLNDWSEASFNSSTNEFTYIAINYLTAPYSVSKEVSTTIYSTKTGWTTFESYKAYLTNGTMVNDVEVSQVNLSNTSNTNGFGYVSSLFVLFFATSVVLILKKKKHLI